VRPTAAELGCGDPDHPCLLDNFLVSDPSLNQVVSRTIEAGVRGTVNFLKKRLRSPGASFVRTENSDDILQVASPIPNHGYFVNAGDTRRQGLEAHIEYHDARWSVHAEYSFLDATFQSRLAISSPFNPVADADGLSMCARATNLLRLRGTGLKPEWTAQLRKTGKPVRTLSRLAASIWMAKVSNRNPKIPAYYDVNLHTSYE